MKRTQNANRLPPNSLPIDFLSSLIFFFAFKVFIKLHLHPFVCFLVCQSLKSILNSYPGFEILRPRYAIKKHCFYPPCDIFKYNRIHNSIPYLFPCGLCLSCSFGLGGFSCLSRTIRHLLLSTLVRNIWLGGPSGGV